MADEDRGLGRGRGSRKTLPTQRLGLGGDPRWRLIAGIDQGEGRIQQPAHRGRGLRRDQRRPRGGFRRPAGPHLGDGPRHAPMRCAHVRARPAGADPQ